MSNELHPIQRIELMTKGLVLTLLRCMHLQAYYKVYPHEQNGPEWILDLRAENATSNVAKLAAQSYRAAYAEIGNDLNILAQNIEDEKLRFISASDGMKDSADAFKKMGKEIQLVIPPKGAYERFSLSEDLVRYLVLFLFPPSTLMTFVSFLQKL